MAGAFHAASLANARRILLVSARSGDGKTQFARCILRHASAVTDLPVRVKTIAMVDPHTESNHGYVWVDGLALLEGEGPAALTPAVRAYLDGALLVARGMLTTRAEVADCADQLRNLGVPVLGGVWNEFDCPPVAEALHNVRAGLWSWPPRFPPRVSARHFRRSS